MICLFRSFDFRTFRLSVFRTFRLSRFSQSKHIFPHHTFHRAGAGGIVLGIIFSIIKAFYFAFHHKIDKLPDGHSCIYFYRLGAGDLQCPGIAKAHIAFAGCGMYLSSPNGWRLTFLPKKGHGGGFQYIQE